jgi:hypothetical protein
MDPHNVQLLNDLGVTEMRMGLHQVAKKRFIKALSMDPNSDLVLDNLIELYELMTKQSIGMEELKHQLHKQLIKANLTKPEHKFFPMKKISIEEFTKYDKRNEKLIKSNDYIQLKSSFNRFLNRPFIIEKALYSWSSDFMRLSDLNYYKLKYADASVDFYPHNMNKEDVKPIIVGFNEAVKALESFPINIYPGVDASEPGTYIQWNINHTIWSELLRDMNLTLPMYFDDFIWLDQCFQMKTIRHDHSCVHTTEGTESCSSASTIDDHNDDDDEKAKSNFHLKTHWKMVLIGEENSGMFLHKDALRTSSFQFQISGRKRWILCPPTQDEYLYRAGNECCLHMPFRSLKPH